MLNINKENLQEDSIIEDIFLSYQQIKIRITTGKYAGETFNIKNPMSRLCNVHTKVGDKIIVSIEETNGNIQIEAGTITFEAKHSSTYAVFVYNKDFEDVSKDDWAYDAINVLVARHIIKGKDEVAFLPNGKITRAEFAALVIRTLGIKEEPYKGKYGDVNTIFSDNNIISEWARDTVADAVKLDIVKGYKDNTFRPKNNATRAEAAAVLYRILEKTGNI